MTIQALYIQTFGQAPETATLLTAAGSPRIYTRLTSLPLREGRGGSVVACQGTNPKENHAFLYLAKALRRAGVNVPEVYAASEDEMCYLQEDLGDLSLFQFIESGRERGEWTKEQIQVLKQVMCALACIQAADSFDLNYKHCFPVPEFNRRSILWDLNYFKYCYLKATGVEFQEDLLEDDFERMASDLLELPQQWGFMYRDFQSRNIMLRDQVPYFIDFQGGRRGPLEYDVVSFLGQAKAKYPADLQETLLKTYMDKCQQIYPDFDRRRFRQSLRYFRLFRLLQVLGAYGFRGYFEHKPHFLQSIPLALEQVKKYLEHPIPQYKELNRICSQFV